MALTDSGGVCLEDCCWMIRATTYGLLKCAHLQRALPQGGRAPQVIWSCGGTTTFWNVSECIATAGQEVFSEVITQGSYLLGQHYFSVEMCDQNCR